MLCNVKCTASKVWTAFSGSILCKNVKLTEPPDAEPHVRWCERSAAKAASYSIQAESIFYFQIHGCLTINRLMLQNNCRDWHNVQQTIDRFIRAGLQEFLRDGE